MSWESEAEDDTPAPPVLPEAETSKVKVAADASLVDAARDFLESWLIRKNYDAAFRYLSPKSYACYDLLRGPDKPAASSVEDAGKLIRAGLERLGERFTGEILPGYAAPSG